MGKIATTLNKRRYSFTETVQDVIQDQDAKTKEFLNYNIISTSGHLILPENKLGPSPRVSVFEKPQGESSQCCRKMLCHDWAQSNFQGNHCQYRMRYHIVLDRRGRD